MGDYYRTTVRIGGTFAPEIIGRFIDLWSAAMGAEIEPGEVEACRGEPIEITDLATRYFQFDELLAFCREHDLTYSMTRDSGGGGLGDVVVWKPDMDSERSHEADDDGQAVIALDGLRAAKAAHLSLDDVINELAFFDEFKVPAVEVVRR